jgi:preprotein translocase subunit Sec63
MSWLRLIVVALGVLFYLRSPIDLVPDRIGPLGLVDDLIVLVLAAWWVWGRLRHAAAERVTKSRPIEAVPVGWDPHAVLGVAAGASQQEITRAYREQMKRYHPDRVADLGEELQQVAHRKSIDIQRAYADLTQK